MLRNYGAFSPFWHCSWRQTGNSVASADGAGSAERRRR